MQRILIIDDEIHILLMLKKMLERAGYEIDIASNGQEGLEIFRNDPPDLVITDIIMPEKEGLETIREMKKEQPDIKILAMSGGGKISADNYLDTARIFGAAGVIEKPFNQSRLITLVGKVLSNQRSEQEGRG
jgi:DNA-binding NtrC family response regulator